MNTIENKIQSELILAMKEKNQAKMLALRSIKTSIMQTVTSPGANKDLSDADIIKIIQKLAKQREESATIYEQNGRPEQARAERMELDVLNTFLPKMLTESEIEKIVNDTITNLSATSMKEMGKVMGLINKEYSGRVDGATVSRIVKSKLS